MAVVSMICSRTLSLNFHRKFTLLIDTYRLLLRREQVHKVVLNQLITVDFDLQQLNTSDRAWIWCGYNFTEDGEHVVEKLAARFKNTDSATKFYNAVQDSMSMLKEHQSTTNTLIPSTLETYGDEEDNPEDQKSKDAQDDDEYEDEYVEEDYDDR